MKYNDSGCSGRMIAGGMSVYGQIVSMWSVTDTFHQIEHY